MIFDVVLESLSFMTEFSPKTRRIYMKRLLTLLLLCVCVFGCDDMQKPVMDVIDEVVTPDPDPFKDVPRITIYDAATRSKITGPWLWMIAETGNRGHPLIDVDALASASEGAVTEIDVATNGVTAGDIIGDLTWTLRAIAGTGVVRHSDNVNDVINRIGFGEGDLDGYSSYALINLVSDTDRPNLTMRVGSDDSIKVWLNGEVVHVYADRRGSNDFQDEFKVDLKAGSNLLLVKVHDFGGQWAMFVGIEDPTIEIVIPETTAPEIPAITFANVLHLKEEKEYRLRPTDLEGRTDQNGDVLLNSLTWGNISQDGIFVEKSDFPADAPKILFRLWIDDPRPYFFSLDGEAVIEHGVIRNQLISDEIVIKITRGLGVSETLGGERGNKFPYKVVTYEGVVIKNLTRPDVFFEYD